MKFDISVTMILLKNRRDICTLFVSGQWHYHVEGGVYFMIDYCLLNAHLMQGQYSIRIQNFIVGFKLYLFFLKFIADIKNC